MGGYVCGGAGRSGRTIMVALVLMVGSFYAGSLFGNNQPIFASQASSSHSGPPSHCLSFLCMWLDSCGILRDLSLNQIDINLSFCFTLSLFELISPSDI